MTGQMYFKKYFNPPTISPSNAQLFIFISLSFIHMLLRRICKTWLIIDTYFPTKNIKSSMYLKLG